MSPPRDSRYDRRIEEIEREIKRVQKAMREVESGRRRTDSAPPASLPRPSFPWRPPPGSSRETAAPSGAGPAPAQGDLFQPPAWRAPAAPAAAPAPQPARPLAHYLAGGGFMGSPLRRDQRHLKAKTIFLLIVLALAIFVLRRLWPG